MRNAIHKFLLTAALLVGCAPAMAQGGYIGIFGGASDHGIDTFCGNALVTSCDTSGIGYKIFGAGMLNPYFGLELGAVDLGKSNITGTTFNGSFRSLGLSFAGIAALPIGPLSIYGKGGWAILNTDYSESSATGSASASETHGELFFGAGVAFLLGKNLMITGEYERYRARVFDETYGINLIGAGVAYKF